MTPGRSHSRPAGEFVVRIAVPAGHDIGPGQLLARVSDALAGRVSPHPLAHSGLQVSFEPVTAPARVPAVGGDRG